MARAVSETCSNAPDKTSTPTTFSFIRRFDHLRPAPPPAWPPATGKAIQLDGPTSNGSLPRALPIQSARVSGLPVGN
jgi:hypothetical protein